MKSPKAIIYLYNGEATIEKIFNPANYALSRLLMESEKISCPIYFFQKSDNQESLKNLNILPFSYWNILLKCLKIGRSKDVIIISTDEQLDNFAFTLKKLFSYKIIIRRGGVFYGKKHIESANFRKKAEKQTLYKSIDLFISTADGTPVYEYAKAFKIPREKVRSWCNGLPVIVNKNNYERKNQVVCISRLSKEKSIDYVLHSFARALPNLEEEYRLVIVGDGPEKPKLSALAQQLNIDKLIDFVGFSFEVDKWLFSSKLLLTGLANNTILEAVATNTYAICVEMGELEDNYKQFSCLSFIPFERGGYGIMNPEEIDLLSNLTASRMLEILNDYKENERPELDYKNLGWEARLQKERDAYIQLINN